MTATTRLAAALAATLLTGCAHTPSDCYFHPSPNTSLGDAMLAPLAEAICKATADYGDDEPELDQAAQYRASQCARHREAYCDDEGAP